MTASARIQNFSGFRARLVSEQTDANQPLVAALLRLGFTIAPHDPQAGWPEDLDPERDLLFLEGDLHPRGIDRDETSSIVDVPVIGLLGVEAPGRLRALMALGATAFLRKPVYGPAVFPAVFLAVNTQRERRHLRAQLAAHDRRRAGRRFVVKAVLALMRRDGCDDDHAYEVLRHAAMRQRLSIETYCEIWLAEEAAEAAAVPASRARL